MTKRYRERETNTCPACGNMLLDPRDRFCAGERCEWEQPKRKRKKPREQD